MLLSSIQRTKKATFLLSFCYLFITFLLPFYHLSITFLLQLLYTFSRLIFNILLIIRQDICARYANFCPLAARHINRTYSVQTMGSYQCLSGSQILHATRTCTILSGTTCTWRTKPSCTASPRARSCFNVRTQMHR